MLTLLLQHRVWQRSYTENSKEEKIIIERWKTLGLKGKIVGKNYETEGPNEKGKSQICMGNSSFSHKALNKGAMGK